MSMPTPVRKVGRPRGGGKALGKTERQKRNKDAAQRSRARRELRDRRVAIAVSDLVQYLERGPRDMAIASFQEHMDMAIVYTKVIQDLVNVVTSPPSSVSPSEASLPRSASPSEASPTLRSSLPPLPEAAFVPDPIFYAF